MAARRAGLRHVEARVSVEGFMAAAKLAEEDIDD
jgi:hypothetical protein